jgi:hypothetical protein
MIVEPELQDIVRQIVTKLVMGEYKDLEQLSRGVRLKADEIEAGVIQYGRTLTLPPNSQFQELDIIQVQNSKVRKFDVRVTLWTVEEGKSNLTLELTLIEDVEKNYKVEIDGIHVL